MDNSIDPASPSTSWIALRQSHPHLTVPSRDLPIPELRAAVVLAKAALKNEAIAARKVPVEPAISITDVFIPARTWGAPDYVLDLNGVRHELVDDPGEEKVHLRVYKPSTDPRAVLIVAHGGGFAVGNLDSEDVMYRTMCHNLSLTVVNVDYRLAPEHLFPTGLLDLYAAVSWTIQNCSTTLGTSIRHICVYGSSAGANLASSISRMLPAAPLLPIHLSLLLVAPVSCAAIDWHLFPLPSLVRNADAAHCSVTDLNMFWSAYGMPAAHPAATVLLQAPPSRREGSVVVVERACLKVCGMDPAFDEGMLYAAKLAEEGSDVRSEVYNGLPHAFWTLGDVLVEGREWLGDVERALVWLLEL